MKRSHQLAPNVVPVVREYVQAVVDEALSEIRTQIAANLKTVEHLHQALAEKERLANDLADVAQAKVNRAEQLMQVPARRR